jgi:membrane fusion protein
MSAAEKNVFDEDTELESTQLPNTPGTEFPPETSALLSWASLRFIRSPSSGFLGLSVVVVALATVSAFVLSKFVQMDLTVKSQGEILADFGTRSALAPMTGQLVELRKKVGDEVKERDVIAVIGMDVRLEREVVSAIESLAKTEADLRLRQTAKNYEFEIQTPSLRLPPGTTIDAMINLEQQAKLFQETRVRLRRGIDSELRPLRQRSKVVEDKIRSIERSKQRRLLELYRESSQEELGRIRNQISSVENDARLRLEQSFGDFLKSVQIARAALETYLAQRQVRAPISGVVVKMLAKENTLVESTRTVAVVMPKDGKFVAAIRVPSRDIVRVSSGQRILFKVEAYPYQTYGAFTGQVLSFEQVRDSSVLGSADANAQARNDDDYVVYGNIEFPEHLSAELKNKMKLVVGMRMETDIVVERKSVGAVVRDALFGKR